MHWGKENNQTLGLTDTGSGLTLIPGDSKHHFGPLWSLFGRIGAYGGRVINGVLAQFFHLTVGPVGPEPTLWLFPWF